jgi:hypothetical protein
MHQRVVAGRAGDVAVAAELFVKKQRFTQGDLGRIGYAIQADWSQAGPGDHLLQRTIQRLDSLSSEIARRGTLLTTGGLHGRIIGLAA